MFEILLGAIALIGLLVGILWLIGLPEEEDTEELAGFVTANWDELEGRIGHR